MIKMTWRELLKKGENELRKAGIEDYGFDAFQLLLHISGFSNDTFYLNDNLPSDEMSVIRYDDAINRRKAKEPLQYIIGKWDFFDSEFLVGEGVLIPRPETEELVGYVIDIIKNNNIKVVYDLCAGSGCIGLSIAKALPSVKCYLFEYYDEAFRYSVLNKQRLNIENAEVIRLDVLNGPSSDLPKADIIVSNPPYIESDEILTLQEEVLKEPVTALDGGKDGLVFYRSIFEKWVDKLSEDGFIAFECGEGQADEISEIFSECFQSRTVYDVYGADRFVICRKILTE